MEALSFLLLPFLACLVVASIHVYLGNHVLARGVIFVDLSLAQVAALGSTFAAVVWSYDLESWQAYVASLVFALAGAALFAFTRGRETTERVPQEAIIGIVYAVSASLVLVLASRLKGHGSDEIERLLLGSVLWVQKGTVIRTALVYLAIGALHFALRKPLLAISFDRSGAHARGLPVRLLDFVFYGSFALVITQSVPIAGVLLVFSYLVVPATIGALLAERLRTRLVIGWISAILASILGLAGSWGEDLPTGSAIVCAFGLLLLLTAVTRFIAGLIRRA